MKIRFLFSIAIAVGVCFSHLSVIHGQIVPGYDQRYVGADYDEATATLPDRSGNGQTATAKTNTVGQDSTVGGTFGFRQTPRGIAALDNRDVFGHTGERLEFTRVNQLGGSGNGFTIQAVFAGDAPGADGASGVFGLSESAGFSGVFLGAQPGNIEVRGGNVDNQGNTAGAFLNDGNVSNAAGSGEFAIYTLVVDPNASAGNVMTATITDPSSGTVLASTALGDPGSAIQGIGNIGGLFVGEVGAISDVFGDQDNFQGAIAEVVVYNSVLSPTQLAQNNNYFFEKYFEVIVGDVNLDGSVDFLDIGPFITAILLQVNAGVFTPQADIDL